MGVETVYQSVYRDNEQMISLDNEAAEKYLGRCREQMAVIDTDLLTLEKGGAEIDEVLLNRVCRSVDSVKRGAGVFDLVKIEELAGRTEEALDSIRARLMIPTPERVSILLAATDRLEELIQNPVSSNDADIAKLLAALSGLRADHQISTADRSPHLDSPRPLILLVEDDFASRLLLQTFLSGHGECHVAVNGREAVEAFGSAYERGQRYDLICMDLMMPEMGGREAVRQIRALEETHGVSSNCGAKIIMTTAVNDIKEVMQCFGELCDAYLTKPIDLNQLLNQMMAYELVGPSSSI
jgi:two-component system chemotaxis response regulator CheY